MCHHKIIKITSPALLGLFCSSLVFFNSNTHALDYSSNTNVQFTFNPTLSVSVSDNLIIDELMPGTYSDSNIVDVSVSTNNVSGYSLSATVGTNSTSNRLVHSSDSNTYFSSLSSNVDALSSFGDNTWGYSYSTDSGSTWISGSTGSTSSGYNGFPQDANTATSDRGKNGVTLINTTNPVDNQTIKFKIGAKAGNNQASGTYTNTINFYAVTKTPPTSISDAFASAGKSKYNGYYAMQDMSTDICNAVQVTNEDSQTELIDIRDGNTYTVSKINGQCWMTQNLRITGTISADKSNFTGNDFNVSEYSLDSSDASYSGHCDDINGFNNACTKDSGNTTTGVWYNYYATTAGTVSGGYNSTAATQDICPTGWHLPSGPNITEGTDINKLFGNTTSGYQAIASGLNEFNATFGGYYQNGDTLNRARGYWWSANAFDYYRRYNINYDSSGNRIAGDDKSNCIDGFFIRCLAS